MVTVPVVTIYRGAGELIEDYPNPKYTPRVAYLLGQFAQELKQHKEAIESYQLIVKVYPDHTLAPDAQFKLAQCYEEAGEFNSALDAYVTALQATVPIALPSANSSRVIDLTLRWDEGTVGNRYEVVHAGAVR